MVRRADPLQPLAWVLLKTAPQKFTYFRGRFRGQSLEVRLAFQHGRNGILIGFTMKRALSGDQLVQKASECPNVRPLVDLLGARLLRAHVARRADNVAGEGLRARQGRRP